MSGHNRYQISRRYKSERGWAGWGESSDWMETADSWQDAINNRLTAGWGIVVPYQVVSETPAADGRSGITEIQFDPPPSFWVGVKIKATLIEEG